MSNGMALYGLLVVEK